LFEILGSERVSLGAQFGVEEGGCRDGCRRSLPGRTSSGRDSPDPTRFSHPESVIPIGLSLLVLTPTTSPESSPKHSIKPPLGCHTVCYSVDSHVQTEACLYTSKGHKTALFAVYLRYMRYTANYRTDYSSKAYRYSNHDHSRHDTLGLYLLKLWYLALSIITLQPAQPLLLKLRNRSPPMLIASIMRGSADALHINTQRQSL